MIVKINLHPKCFWLVHNTVKLPECFSLHMSPKGCPKYCAFFCAKKPANLEEFHSLVAKRREKGGK